MVKDAQGGLSLLVDTERELDADLAAARAEGARLAAAARVDADVLVRRLDDEVAASVAALRTEFAAERARRLKDIAVDARREAERYDRVDDERALRIANALVDGLIVAGGDDSR